MKDRVIPGALRQRLRSFFLSNKAERRRAQHQHIISSMSPGLQGEVVVAINRRWLTNVSFLNQFVVEAQSSEVFSAFVVDISKQMQLSVHAQSEYFGASHELHILIRGLVTHNGQVRRSGSVWGEDFVLSDSWLVEPPECFSLTYVELMSLGRETFMQLVEKHKSTCPELKRRVRRFCCWLAFQRALLHGAKLRRQKLLVRGSAHARRDTRTPRRSGRNSMSSPCGDSLAGLCAVDAELCPVRESDDRSGNAQAFRQSNLIPQPLAL